MFSKEQYELIDFGDGEKLENFAGTLVRRESPVAMGPKSMPEQWQDAFQYKKQTAEQGIWAGDSVPPKPWVLNHGKFSFELKPTPFGHLGVFPEQAENWSWIDALPFDLVGLKALNLFAYTGGTTMALAARGAAVAHVDSAKNIVNWARTNATLSQMNDVPIRWLVEDAITFVSREIKRGNYYDVIVADPPSFGRGTRKETWKLQRDITQLVQLLAKVSAGQCRAILFSCHTPEFDAVRLESHLASQFDLSGGTGERIQMGLQSCDDRRLQSGSCFRWFSKSPK